MRNWLRPLASQGTALVVSASLVAGVLLVASPGIAGAAKRPSAPAKVAGAHRPGSRPSEQAPVLHVLFVGASITSGLEQTSMGDTYPGKVVEGLRLRGLRVEWDERARAGALVGDGLTWPYPGDQQVIVVHLITNDFLHGTPLGIYQHRLHEVLAALRERSPGATLICLGTWEAPGTANRDQISLETYDAAAGESCGREHGVFVPLDAIFVTPGARGPLGQATPWGPTDGWHPNNVGAQLIANAVLTEIPEGVPS